jgi:hypothetical protein
MKKLINVIDTYDNICYNLILCDIDKGREAVRKYTIYEDEGKTIG